jgi:hypothetical protein
LLGSGSPEARHAGCGWRFLRKPKPLSQVVRLVQVDIDRITSVARYQLFACKVRNNPAIVNENQVAQAAQ